MPGRHLSNREKSLAAFWREPPANFGQALLKGVTLKGPPSLRGIRDIHAPFDYPITAICGRNGAGKSTILGLAAFSACRPGTWSVSARRVPSVRPALRTMSFAWDEFFFRRAGDPTPSGLKVQFDYTYKGDDVQVSRVRTAKGRWATAPDPGRSRTPRLPERPIDFVSLARIIPPGELRSLRRRFSGSRAERVVSLTENSVRAMSTVFGQSYESVAVHTQRGVPLAHCRGTAHYTGFDMGSGENSAVAILAALERLPPGGLLLVEEIEHGFHPLAQRRLVDVLTEMVSRGKQQIICTTHSEYVIDALPQAARLLVDRGQGGHRAVLGQTTRDLMFTMTGEPRPELTVYVEDYFAQTVRGASARRSAPATGKGRFDWERRTGSRPARYAPACRTRRAGNLCTRRRLHGSGDPEVVAGRRRGPGRRALSEAPAGRPVSRALGWSARWRRSRTSPTSRDKWTWTSEKSGPFSPSWRPCPIHMRCPASSRRGARSRLTARPTCLRRAGGRIRRWTKLGVRWPRGWRVDSE